ncbi:MAG: hypothetical protein O2931_05960, partial [Planctomycetota bacterium]|nr:hypothetical protein [Planctomycetota bacterium]
SVEWLTKKGRTYIEMKEYGSAEEVLLRAVEHAPGDSEPHYELERLYLRTNRSDKALYHGNLAADSDPKNILRVPDASRMETAENSVGAESIESAAGEDTSTVWPTDRRRLERESVGSAGLPEHGAAKGRERNRVPAEVPSASRLTDSAILRHRRQGKTVPNSKERRNGFEQSDSPWSEADRPDRPTTVPRSGLEFNRSLGTAPTPSRVPMPGRDGESDSEQTATTVPGWQNRAFSLSAPPPTGANSQFAPGGVRWHSASGGVAAWPPSDAGSLGRPLPSLTSSPTPSLFSVRNYGGDAPLPPRGVAPGIRPSISAPRPAPLRSGVRTQMGPLPTAPSGNP